MPFGGLLTAGLAAGGLAKGLLIDKPKENRQRALAAETARYSPWTHMQPQAVQEADPFGSALQGGMTGASFGQSVANANSARGFQDAMTKSLGQGGQQVVPMSQQISAWQPPQFKSQF